MSSTAEWYFLSERGLERERRHISYGINYELEDLLVRMTGGTILAPANAPLFCAARRVPKVGRAVGWAAGQTLGRYQRLPVAPDGRAKRVLFVMGMGSRSLRILNAIPGWRRCFDVVIGFVLDSFEPFPHKIASQLDHLFVIIPELVEELHRRLGIPVTFIPLACNVLDLGSARADRGVDVLAYGRQWDHYGEALDQHFLAPASPRLYLTSFSHPSAPDALAQRKQFWSVLARSRISVAFAPDASRPRFLGLPVVTARWYEGLAAGCVMVGRRPLCSTFQELFHWTDAAIELPESPADAPGAIEALLEEPDRLHRAHMRNHLMMLKHLDARLVFQSMCKTLGVDLPAVAARELDRLNRRVQVLEQGSIGLGIAHDHLPTSIGAR